MVDFGSRTTVTKLLGLICLFILGGVLAAGLWPFHSPPNQVRWLTEGKGLQFGHHGTLLSSGIYKADPAQGDAPCSIEIWLQPGPGSTSGTILAFYAREAPRRFWLSEFHTELDLQSEVQEGHNRGRTSKLYVSDVFRLGKPTFVTITSGAGETAVYINGVLAKSVGSFPLSGRDLASRLLIANSPKTCDSWSGVLRGLALFHQKLTAEQVLRHYETWTKNGRPEVGKDDQPAALYLLNVGAGNLIHNQIPGEPDLYIPERFLVVDEYFLEPFWQEFNPSWGYWQDVLVNIAGFVPLGFMFCAYLSIGGWVKRPVLATIFLGLAVSLTIEVTQSFLPTRDSGTTDLITNTSGAALGVWLYRVVSRHDLLKKSLAYLSGRAGIGVL